MIALSIVVFALAILAVVIATRPARFRIERSLVIDAAPEAIFPLIDDLRNWTRWSPWEGLDPNLERSYSGSASGPGASYAWKGTPKVGSGSMTIRETIPGRRISMDLEFLKPFKASNTTLFTLTPGQTGTVVTWVMEGRNGFVFKAFGLFMKMDTLVGKDFEKGLASLAKAALPS